MYITDYHDGHYGLIMNNKELPVVLSGLMHVNYPAVHEMFVDMEDRYDEGHFLCPDNFMNITKQEVVNCDIMSDGSLSVLMQIEVDSNADY